MRRFPRTLRGVLLLLGVSTLTAVAVACGGSPTSPAVLPTLAEMTADKTMGDAGAAHSVIVYSSFTCPHCADFHLQTIAQLKSKYIDAGKVRLVFRDWERGFDLDIHAAMLARCAGDARYFDAVDTLFRNQASWAGSGEQALANVMRQFGMSQQVIDACLATTALHDAIVKSHNDAVSKWGVSGTPTSVVDDEHVIVGDVPLSGIEPYLK